RTASGRAGDRRPSAHREWEALRWPRDSSFWIMTRARRLARVSSLDVDHVLLVVVRILLEVAHRLRIRWLLLRPALHHLELPVLRFGDVDVEAAVVRLRVDRRLAGRARVADVAL